MLHWKDTETVPHSRASVRNDKGACVDIKVKVLVAQLYPTLCGPIDCSLCQAPLSMEFSR